MTPKARVYKEGLVARKPFTGWCQWPECGKEVTVRQGREHSGRHQREDMQKEINRRLQKVLKGIAQEKARQAASKAAELEQMADSISEPDVKAEYRRRAIALRKEAEQNA